MTMNVVEAVLLLPSSDLPELVEVVSAVVCICSDQHLSITDLVSPHFAYLEGKLEGMDYPWVMQRSRALFLIPQGDWGIHW
jgi:hypothetical protein